ncbi:MAG: response regulator, partial [Steroidobacteraceae bacterium]
MATNHEVGSSNLSGRAISSCGRMGAMETEAINRLLVVDDEAAQVEALCRTLEDEGYSVKGFTGARAALAALTAGSFDIVLTDLT